MKVFISLILFLFFFFQFVFWIFLCLHLCVSVCFLFAFKPTWTFVTAVFIPSSAYFCITAFILFYFHYDFWGFTFYNKPWPGFQTCLCFFSFISFFLFSILCFCLVLVWIKMGLNFFHCCFITVLAYFCISNFIPFYFFDIFVCFFLLPLWNKLLPIFPLLFAVSLLWYFSLFFIQQQYSSVFAFSFFSLW